MQRSRPAPVQVVAVQDGDSLIVRPLRSRSDERLRVRLFAIDAPELDQQYGHEARDCLRQLVGGRTDLMMELAHTDQYQRQVAVLYYRRAGRSRSINRMMVEQGHARWYSNFGGQDLGLEQAERDARRRRRGLWAPNRQVAPWEHRQAQRRAAHRGGSTGCLKWLLLGVGVAAAVAVLLARFA